MTIKTIYFFEGMRKIISLLIGGIVIFLYSEGNAQVYRDQDRDGLIEISYIESLDSMRYNLTGTCSQSTCNGYELMRNLDFNSTSSYRSGNVNSSYTTGSGWDPIGIRGIVSTDSSFNTTFEGNGYTIDHLYIKRTANGSALFGYTRSNSRIRNIGMTNVSVSGFARAGGLVGTNNRGSITNSYATGYVSGSDWVGGLVGWNLGTITKSYATDSVTGSAAYLGGLVGKNELGTITESYAEGKVKGTSLTSRSYYVGGLVGWNYGGTITQSHATGSVSDSSTVGGLVGFNDGSIIKSYATGNVRGSARVGGLVGDNSEEGTNKGTIIQCYATGSVTGSSVNVGGLVGISGLLAGKSTTIITQSHATGNVTGRGNYVGGLVGSSLDYNTITESYATGNVSSDSNVVGGLVGGNDGYITQSYATGNVRGKNYVGGLVGLNYLETITQIYATGNVTGSDFVGALVGHNDVGVGLPEYYESYPHGYWNKNATQTVGGSERSNSNKRASGITGNIRLGRFVRGLTLPVLKSPTGNASDSIQELGPGFIYKQGQLPTLHLGARVIVNNINFTQTVPSITRIGISSTVTDIIQGTDITRATLKIDGLGFTANLIDTTSGRLKPPYIFANIQNVTSNSITFAALGPKTYGDVPFVLAARSSVGLALSFSASNTLVSITIDNVTTIKGAGTVNITAYQPENEESGQPGYVQPDPVVRILTINKASQSIIFGSLAEKTFGDAPFVLNAIPSAGFPILYSASSTLVSIDDKNMVTIYGAGTVNITTYNDANNFTPNSVTQILTINKESQSINFDALASKTFGDASFVLSASSSVGFIVSFSASNTLVSITIDNVTINGAGTVSITVVQTGDDNYLPASATQILTIDKANQGISFEPLANKTLGNAPFVLAATSPAGLAVSFSASSTLVSISNNMVTINGIGTVSITAFQTGNDNYLPASATTQILTITQKLELVAIIPAALTFIETHNTSIHIFPNPANDYITIQYDKTQKVSSVKVYDMTGKNYELKMNNYELGMKADVKNLPKGEYILVIYGEEGKVLKTEKVIKEL